MKESTKTTKTTKTTKGCSNKCDSTKTKACSSK